MSIERDKKEKLMAIVCDGCGDLETYGIDDPFQDAIDDLRSKGWQNVKTADGWAHYCRECK